MRVRTVRATRSWYPGAPVVTRGAVGWVVGEGYVLEGVEYVAVDFGPFDVVTDIRVDHLVPVVYH